MLDIFCRTIIARSFQERKKVPYVTFCLYHAIRIYLSVLENKLYYSKPGLNCHGVTISWLTDRKQYSVDGSRPSPMSGLSAC